MDPLERVSELRRRLAEATPDVEHDHHGPEPCWCGATPQEKAVQSYHPREEGS